MIEIGVFWLCVLCTSTSMSNAKSHHKYGEASAMRTTSSMVTFGYLGVWSVGSMIRHGIIIRIGRSDQYLVRRLVLRRLDDLIRHDDLIGIK